jgi:predicted ATPase with chaperone activity
MMIVSRKSLSAIARKRVKAVIRNADFRFPQHRVTVNVASAKIPKDAPESTSHGN